MSDQPDTIMPGPPRRIGGTLRSLPEEGPGLKRRRTGLGEGLAGLDRRPGRVEQGGRRLDLAGAPPG